MRRLRIRAIARADIKEIMSHISKDSPRAAQRFLGAVEQLAQRLIDSPELGAVYESEDCEFAGLRVFTIPRFRKFLVFYRFEGDVIDIVRILHGARDLPAILERDS